MEDPGDSMNGLHLVHMPHEVCAGVVWSLEMSDVGRFAPTCKLFSQEAMDAELWFHLFMRTCWPPSGALLAFAEGTTTPVGIDWRARLQARSAACPTIVVDVGRGYTKYTVADGIQGRWELDGCSPQLVQLCSSPTHPPDCERNDQLRYIQYMLNREFLQAALNPSHRLHKAAMAPQNSLKQGGYAVYRDEHDNAKPVKVREGDEAAGQWSVEVLQSSERGILSVQSESLEPIRMAQDLPILIGEPFVITAAGSGEKAAWEQNIRSQLGNDRPGAVQVVSQAQMALALALKSQELCWSQFSGGGHVGTNILMLSTFDSSEARVGIMVAGVELQQKLLHRMRMLPGEAAQAETLTPDVDKKPSPSKSSSDEDRLEDMASEASRLRQQILNAKKEKDLANRRRQKIENDSVRHHTNTAKQIANYHCRLQAMRNTITADKEEANILRQNRCNSERKKQCHQAQARKLKEEAESCKAHKAKLVVEVQVESDKLAALWAEVKSYEQALKEVLERKVLAEAEVTATRMSQVTQQEEDDTRNFAMHSGSEDEQEDENEEEEARVLNELELAYEGLELSSIMPIPAAVRLATGHISHQETMSKVDIPETGFLEREGIEFSRWTRPSPSGNKDWTEEELE
ncbi:unnamed protein product, partial [Symbiodinium necroappetens]